MPRLLTLIIVLLVNIGAFLVPSAIAGMKSENFQAKDTAVVIGGTLMSSSSFIGQLVVDQPTSLNEVVVCFGYSGKDTDVDGQNLASFAATTFIGEDLVKFSKVFGTTNCEKLSRLRPK